MLIKDKSKLLFVAIVVFSMVAMYGYTPLVHAAGFDLLTDTISDSTPSDNADHVIDFDLGDTPLVPGMYIRITFDSNFGDPGDPTCPGIAVASSTAGVDFSECIVQAGQFLDATTTTHQITVSSLANPAIEGDYSVTVSTHQSDGTEIELSETKIYIINDVTVEARVPAFLDFTLSPLGPYSTKNYVNGALLTGTSTATLLDFGTLDSTSSSSLAHSISVQTNASDGFSVTVEQDGELTTGAGADINSFANSPTGTGSSTQAYAWISPGADINKNYTWGHMGITTDDTTDTTVDFTSEKFAGLNSTDPLEIMAHTNPTVGTVQNSGLAAVAYKIEISSLQEAGDYDSTLTYICTPTF
jgi:hypothetical protein